MAINQALLDEQRLTETKEYKQATAETISELIKNKNNFVMVDMYEKFVSMTKREIINVIEINALCLAKFILAYPYVNAYKPIYTKCITNILIDDSK